MTLRLALVIDGDAKGAGDALAKTSRAVEELGRKADGAGDKLNKITIRENKRDNSFAPLSKELEELGKKAGPAADALDEVNAAAPGAAAGIVNVGNAAGEAGGKFGSLKAAALGAIGGIAAGLATAAIGGLIEAALGSFVSYVREIVDDTPRINRDIASHRDLIKQIKGAYAEAEGAASSYGNKSREVLTFNTQQDIARLQRDFQGSLAPISSAENPLRGSSPFGDTIASFNNDLKDGLANIIEFRRRISEQAAGLEEDSPWRAYAEQVIQATEKSATLQEELQRSIDLYKGLTGDADAAATALGGSAEKFTLNGEAAGSALPMLREYDALLKSIAGTPAVAATASPGLSQTTQGGFAAGGWTGDVGTDQVAGVVHGREFVVNARATARHRPLLEAINAGVPGYAAGGYVGGYGTRLRGPDGRFVSASANVEDGVSDLARDFAMLRGSLSGFLGELVRSRDLLQALGGVIQTVSDRFLNSVFNKLDQLAFGGGAGGGFGWLGNLFGLGSGLNAFPAAPGIGVGLYHGGGDVGSMPTMTRSVPSSVFIGAPRLHGGGWLKPGERPVIAMDGEEIGWPDQLARKYGGGQTTIVNNNFNVSTPTPRAFAESKATAARAAARFTGRLGRYS
ncbi:hypothetical protein ASD44_09615 [Mesorhizobium sp. Root554]|uniref:hypothetical protein n=1 Tax=unclassified Mesorhizobium TaxID=325217 RepID=UPI0006FD42D4|nr:MULTISPECIES: hypothetical protein [unclassified Mesorhizobium]KQZ14300.1 hypothetical protein ASD27_09625 [Mesorhizobium sp. Root1471]KQZ36811.1 hypothetical protein ASD44_09615 [Mesorhizobium sp. Root554]